MSITSDSSPVRIALLDDDSGLLTVMERRFTALRWQHEVLSYPPVPAELACLRVQALMVNPALTGLEYIEQLSAKAPSLAILAVASHGTVADRVRALRGGADDWIPKPVHPEELIARMQAVLRRRHIGEQLEDEGAIVAGELSIRPDRFDAYVGGEPAGLSRKEYELLRQLASADGRVLERDVVYQRVWGYMMVRGDRSVDVFVRKLRTKLERISPDWRYVHTHFGVGYRFAAEPVPGKNPAPASAEPLPQDTGHKSPAGAANSQNPAVPLGLALSR